MASASPYKRRASSRSPAASATSAEMGRGEHDVRRRIESLGQRTRRLMAAGGLGELASMTVNEAKTVDRRRFGDGEPSSRASSTATLELLPGGFEVAALEGERPQSGAHRGLPAAHAVGRADVARLADGGLGFRRSFRLDCSNRLCCSSVMTNEADVADRSQPDRSRQCSRVRQCRGPPATWPRSARSRGRDSLGPGSAQHLMGLLTPARGARRPMSTAPSSIARPRRRPSRPCPAAPDRRTAR